MIIQVCLPWNVNQLLKMADNQTIKAEEPGAGATQKDIATGVIDVPSLTADEDKKILRRIDM